MLALFDVNTLIALLDANHVFHERAHSWWGAQQSEGWASCPLTENGVVRVMSQPAYSASVRFSPAEILGALRSFRSATRHTFWPDSVSLLDDNGVVDGLIVSPKQVTDIYLLALAVANAGRLVTFDADIPCRAVIGCRPEHLVLLG